MQWHKTLYPKIRFAPHLQRGNPCHSRVIAFDSSIITITSRRIAAQSCRRHHDKHSLSNAPQNRKEECICSLFKRGCASSDADVCNFPNLALFSPAIIDLAVREYIKMALGPNYDFARKLGLRLKSHKQTKVSGMGGVPTYIGASAEIKLTLGPRVVYIVDVWVANIGEGIDVLLGMGFMFAAGVRISTREGLVSLPDEVVVMMCIWKPGDHIGRS
ncbi:Hypothetical protein PHPALM_36375, partial [Phytophthora palmivora]